jgi:DNA helicase HerA-like ATPase
MFHPDDLAFVSSILPNVSKELISKLKTFHSGMCITYGSAFKMPLVVRVDEPTPPPLSQNVDIKKVWYVKQQ